VGLLRRAAVSIIEPAGRVLKTGETSVETEWYNRAEAIQKRIIELRDSL